MTTRRGMRKLRSCSPHVHRGEFPRWDPVLSPVGSNVVVELIRVHAVFLDDIE